MTAVNNFLLFIALHFAYVYCRIQHDLSVKRVDQRIIAKSRQNTLDMCRMFTAENNHLPSPNYIAPNRQPAKRHNHTVIHKTNQKRVKRDIFATAGLRFDEARRVESIVDNLYDEVTENGAPVMYRTKRLETTTTKKRNRNKPSRRFNFAPALLDWVPVGHENLKKEAAGPSAGFPWPKKWKHGIVPYFIDSKTYDDALSETIIKAFDYIEKATCIRMQRLREKPVDQDSMKKVEWLYISNPSGIRQCVHTNEKKKNKGVQMVIFGYDCLRNGDVLHEVMHILGFSHEHTRPDRNEHLSILWDNIKPGYKRYFEVRSEDLLMNLPYDYASVLHYPPRAFSKNGQLTILAESGVKIGQRDGLSETDVEKVGLVYGFECVERNREYLISTCPRVVRSNDKPEPNVTKEEITSYFNKRIWPYGIVNFKLKNLAEFSIEERENIKSVIRHIEKETCIEFRDLTEYTNIDKDKGKPEKEKHVVTKNNPEAPSFTSENYSSVTDYKEENPTTTIKSNNFVNKDTKDNEIPVTIRETTGSDILADKSKEVFFKKNMFSKENERFESKHNHDLNHRKYTEKPFTGDNKGIGSEAKVPIPEKPLTGGNKGISSEVKVTLEHAHSKDDVLEGELLDSRSKEKFFKKKMFSDKNINNQEINTGINNLSPGNAKTNDVEKILPKDKLDSHSKENKKNSSEVKVTLEHTHSKDDVLEGELLDSRSKEVFFKEKMFSGKSNNKQESNTGYNNLSPGNTDANDAQKVQHKDKLYSHSKENKGISSEVKVPTPEKPLTGGNKGISSEVKVTLEHAQSKDDVLEGELLDSRSKENFFKEKMFSGKSINNQESNTEYNNLSPGNTKAIKEKLNAENIKAPDLNIQSLIEKKFVAKKSHEEKGDAQKMFPKGIYSKETFFKENLFSEKDILADNKKSLTETNVVSHKSTENGDAPKMLRKEKEEEVLKGELDSHSKDNTFRDNMFSEKMLAASDRESLIEKKVVSHDNADNYSAQKMLRNEKVGLRSNEHFFKENLFARRSFAAKALKTSNIENSVKARLKLMTRRQNVGNHNKPTQKKQVSLNIPAKKTYRSKRSVLSPSRRHAQDILILERSAQLGCNCPTPGRPNGAKVLKINTECFNSVNDLLHLFVHVLGLDHQHNMHDRDSYLHVAWDKLTPEIKEEMKDKLPPAASAGFPYDYQSVMHYPWLQIKNGVTNIMYPIWNDGWAMGHWQGLSSTDVSKLNLLYAEQCSERRRLAKQ